MAFDVQHAASAYLALLCAVEGFSVPEAARILGVDADKVDELIDAAGREIAAQVATDVASDDPDGCSRRFADRSMDGAQ